MAMNALDRLIGSLAESVERRDDRVIVRNRERISSHMDGLIREAVFGEAAGKAAARWLIWEISQSLGIRPASIHELYAARGRGEIARTFTIPAVNLRMLAYDSARAVFRAAR
jgi:fructose-bisphosphate aldolase class II